jgi:8-oxo-dGTP pyrophosphatase MutT (NUDIX family)
LNPFPIIIIAVPIVDENGGDIGILGLQRNIDPGRGEFCMPGGYIERHESWQEAGIRETYEETGVVIKEVTFHSIVSIDGFLAVFGVSEDIQQSAVDFTFSNEETQGVTIFTEPRQLAFKIQTAFLKEAFSTKGPNNGNTRRIRIQN